MISVITSESSFFSRGLESSHTASINCATEIVSKFSVPSSAGIHVVHCESFLALLLATSKHFSAAFRKGKTPAIMSRAPRAFAENYERFRAIEPTSPAIWYDRSEATGTVNTDRGFLFLFGSCEGTAAREIFINRVSLKNVGRVRESVPFVEGVEKRGGKKGRGGLVAHQHSKCSRGRRAPLFGREEEQKPPRERRMLH